MPFRVEQYTWKGPILLGVLVLHAFLIKASAWKSDQVPAMPVTVMSVQMMAPAVVDDDKSEQVPAHSTQSAPKPKPISPPVARSPVKLSPRQDSLVRDAAFTIAEVPVNEGSKELEKRVDGAFSAISSTNNAAEVVVTKPTYPAYLNNPQPVYPVLSRQENEHGTVRLRVLVSVDGRAKNVQVAESSGYPRLDRAALTTVKELWRFHPATRAGVPFEASVMVPFNFFISGGKS